MRDKKAIHVATCTMDEFFKKKKLQTVDKVEIRGQLNIPAYQRPYVWGKKQLNQLISDIQIHQQKNKDAPYYLGSIILHAENGLFNIIDGQQRITTLLLFGFLKKVVKTSQLSYSSYLSVCRIKENLNYLDSIYDEWKEIIDLSKLVVSLVITHSEDDAYKFFETQNTGGVRLTGPDIIKAHHLRVIPPHLRQDYAVQWENLGNLQKLMLALIRGRYWNHLKFKKLPESHVAPQIRDAIVEEFATNTSESDQDIAFNIVKIQHVSETCVNHCIKNYYQLRQPLNTGINSISYFGSFKKLYVQYFQDLTVKNLEDYVLFIQWLKQLEGCSLLKELYVTGLLLYLSHFGEENLFLFAQKFFRVAYSKRVSNKKTVRMDSVSTFARETKVLDIIATAYTTQQVLNNLDQMEIQVEKQIAEGNSFKKSFMLAVNKYFDLGLNLKQPATEFAEKFSKKIRMLGK